MSLSVATRAWVEEVTHQRVEHVDRMQSLWSGYGWLYRIHLSGAGDASVVLKEITPPARSENPYGWNDAFADARKKRSYRVERAFYRDYSHRCTQSSRVANFIASAGNNSGVLLLLEDLDESGFPIRRSAPSQAEIHQCLRWLAVFHATFLSTEPTGLWPEGTYWHLSTRPKELEATNDARLKAAAGPLDEALRCASFRTVVHGDAKIANFCFGSDAVCAVDFQYVGGGVGVKDVAYFLGSCLSERECEHQAEQLLDYYFRELTHALPPSIDAAALIGEWHALYPIAWADFHRFLSGWAPAHTKIHRYTARMTDLALEHLSLATI